MFLKGQSHEKVGKIRPWDFSLGSKSRYGFFNFSDRPFYSCDPLKIKFCLINPVLSWKDLVPRRIAIWYPERLYPIDNGVRYNAQGSAHRKHWNPVRPSSHTEGFLLAFAMMEGLYYWFNGQLIKINKLESGEEQHHSI
jgi:hypothetical protein